MRKTLLALTLVLVSPALYAAGDNGLVHVKTNHSVAKAAERFVHVIQEKGLTLFTQVDHAAGGNKVDLPLRPTHLVIFGNPKLGTPLMQCNQALAMDLPQKLLVWEDGNKQVWMTYNDPTYLAKRHELGDCAAEMVKTIGVKLPKLVEAAAADK